MAIHLHHLCSLAHRSWRPWFLKTSVYFTPAWTQIRWSCLYTFFLCIVKSELWTLGTPRICVHWQCFSDVLLTPFRDFHYRLRSVFNLKVLPKGLKVRVIQGQFSFLSLMWKVFLLVPIIKYKSRNSHIVMPIKKNKLFLKFLNTFSTTQEECLNILR